MTRWRPTSSVALLVALLTTVVTVLACGETPAPVGPDEPAEIPPGPYQPGQSYEGYNGYIEYIAGNSPLILSVPHGGALTPAGIPDRTASSCGGEPTTVTDRNTVELAMAIREALFEAHGTYPHVVLNHLRRTKLDANRDLELGACGDPEAEVGWNQFHAFIEVARDAVLLEGGRGWYMDVHGHGHTIQRLELGYLLSASDLALSDDALDADPAYEAGSSLSTLSKDDGAASFSALLRGPASLGALYQDRGFPAVPSPAAPDPGGDPYFTGGYSTQRHTCGAGASAFGGTPGGGICGVQLEAYYEGVRDNATNRRLFAEATLAVLEAYLGDHWGVTLDPS